MAGPYDPFSAQGGDPTQGLPQPQDLQQQWQSFLADPRGRGALLSAGLALLQPPSFGDTAASQIGRAVGAGGESVTTNEALDIKQQEANSKDLLRTAQADRATALASNTGNSANIALQRLELAKTAEGGKTERNLLANRVRLANMYQSYLKDAQKNAVLNPTTPILSMQDWIGTQPEAIRGLLSTDQTGASAFTPSPGAGGGVGATIEVAPADPKQRKAGQQYKTPNGETHTWTGTGWR